MKIRNLYLSLAFVLSAFAAMAQTGSGKTYVISGSIPGLPDGEVKLVRTDINTDTLRTLNTAKVKNGKFEFKGSVDAPELMILTINPGNWQLKLFVENSKISMAIDTAGAQHYDYRSRGGQMGALLTKYSVSGSSAQNQWDGYEKNSYITEKMPGLIAMSKAYYAEKDADSREKIKRDMAVQGSAINQWQLQYIKDFAAKNSSSVAGLYMFYEYYRTSNMDAPTLETILFAYSGEAKKSVYYTYFAKELAEKQALLPGHKVEDFTLLKPDGDKFTLSSLKGKYVMLDFWASWCVPCRQAIPHWKEVYAKYKDSGLEIVSVTNDSRREDWIKAMDAEKMPWTQITDEFPVRGKPARVINRFKTNQIPFYVLLDKEGRIISRTGDERLIDEKLKTIFQDK